MKTGVIKYNVNQRNREHRGVDRNFDTAALAELINGGAVQEQVKNRDLYGYYGHWPRIKFGLNPTEGAIVNGKVVHLEPALVTTYLKAFPDGTIEHEAEFMDNGAGRIAMRLWQNKRGGFSSAIDTRKAGNKLFPTGFFGFDYVLEPNYTTNRGFALDSVSAEELATLDDVTEYGNQIAGFNTILDSMQRDFELQQQTVAHLAEQNEELIEMLLKMNGGNMPVFDRVSQMPDLVGGGENRLARADEFLSAELVPFQPSPDEAKEQPTNIMNKAVSSFFNRRSI